jgi:hypothetical protein
MGYGLEEKNLFSASNTNRRLQAGEEAPAIVIVLNRGKSLESVVRVELNRGKGDFRRAVTETLSRLAQSS